MPISSTKNTRGAPEINRTKAFSLPSPRNDSDGGFNSTNDFYRQIVNSLEDYAVFTTDTKGIINSWNTGAEKLLEYSQDEVLGRSASLFFTPEDLKKKSHEKELKTARKFGESVDERWHIKKSGKRFWASGKVFFLSDKKGTILGFTKIMRDITQHKIMEEERKKLNQELEIERNKLEEVFELAPAFMALLQGKNHVFEIVNKAYYQLIGNRDILHKAVIEGLPEIKGQGFIEILDSVYQSGKPFVGKQLKFLLQQKSGTPLQERYLDFIYQPIKDINNQTTGIFVHGYDVTEVVKARQSFEQTAGELEAVINSIPDGVIISDQNGIKKANKQAVKILGFNSEKDIYKNISLLINKLDLRHSDNEKKITYKNSALAQALSGKKIVYEAVITNQLTRQKQSIRAAAAPIYNGREIKGAVAVVTDITDRKRLESQKDEFIGIASHELKTPVTSIKAYTQVLKYKFQQQGDLESATQLSKMDAQLNKLTNLIGDLLDVTKIEAGKLRFEKNMFDFDELVNEVTELMQLTTNRHKIILKCNTNQNIVGDRERTGQVLTNLISNAIKYSPRSKKICVTGSTDNNFVYVSVKDFGIGMSKVSQMKVFDRFYRVSGPNNQSFPGLGLGLYISAEIIKRLGGTIWVESTKGRGSTFSFSLPIIKEKLKQLEEPKT